MEFGLDLESGFDKHFVGSDSVKKKVLTEIVGSTQKPVEQFSRTSLIDVTALSHNTAVVCFAEDGLLQAATGGGRQFKAISYTEHVFPHGLIHF